MRVSLNMKTVRSVVVVGLFAVAAACVTVNVYFPEAAAEQAADRFIEKVIGEEARSDASAMKVRFNPLDFFLPAAHAQEVNIEIDTPAIQAIQARMEARFNNELRGYFDAGAIGFTNDAMVEVRDIGAVGLRDRNALKAAVNEDNADRRAVYREIAVANGHPEWESQIRAIFAERWIAKARAGWWYQNSGGNWVQK